MLTLDSTIALGVGLAQPTTTNPLDVFVSYTELNTTAPWEVPVSAQANTTASALQTLVLASPPAGTQRRVKYLSVFNRDVPTQVTIYIDTKTAAAGPTDYTAAYDSNDASNVIATGYSQLTDLSGNARHLSQGTAGAQPTQVSDTINGVTKNVMNFDGSNDVIASTADVSTFISQTAWTAIVECKLIGAQTPGGGYTTGVAPNQWASAISDDQGNTFQGVMFRRDASTSRHQVGCAGLLTNFTYGYAVDNSGVPDQVWQTYASTYDGTNFKIRTNGGPPVSGNTGTVGTMAAAVVNIGRGQNTSSQFLQGRIGRLRIFNRTLTEDEIKSTLAEFQGLNVVRNVYTAMLGANETLQYTDGEGFVVLDPAGNRQGQALGTTPPKFGFMEVFPPRALTAAVQGTIYLQRTYVPQLFVPDTALFAMFMSNSAAASNTVTVNLGVYQNFSSTWFLAYQASRSIHFGGSTFDQSVASGSGTKMWSIPTPGWYLPAGDYLIGWGLTVSTSLTSGTYSYLINRSNVSINGSEFGGGTGNGTAPILYGAYSAASSVLPLSIAWSQVNQTGAAAAYGAQPWLAFARTNATATY